MMEAYGDGARFNGTGFYGVAVLLALLNAWAALQPRWLAALHDFDPTLHVFHMTDFMAGAKPYRGRSRDDRERLLKRLVRTLCDHVTFGYACVLLPDAQRTLVQLNAERGESSLGENFYAPCADGCIGKLSHRLGEIGPTQRVGRIHL